MDVFIGADFKLIVKTISYINELIVTNVPNTALVTTLVTQR